MDRECFVRLNQILREVSERGRPIVELDAIPTWFEGTLEEVRERMEEVQELLDDAHSTGMISRWVEKHAHRGPSTNWDWTGAARIEAKRLGIILADPLGNLPPFSKLCNRITMPVEMIRLITLDALDDDVRGHFNRVYEEQVRYVISYQGKPVAAVVPLLDLELLKDIQVQVDPCKWTEWIQDLRQRLCWPPVSPNEKEA